VDDAKSCKPPYWNDVTRTMLLSGVMPKMSKLRMTSALVCLLLVIPAFAQQAADSKACSSSISVSWSTAGPCLTGLVQNTTIFPAGIQTKLVCSPGRQTIQALPR
jgi:hypothetical protein